MNTHLVKALISLLLCTVVSATQAQPSDHQHHHEHAHQHQTEDTSSDYNSAEINGTENTACENLINVSVNGLVCDFCARALEKVFGKRADVKGINVDLDNANVSIAMKDNQTLDDATVTKLITDSGYNVVNIARDCPK